MTINWAKTEVKSMLLKDIRLVKQFPCKSMESAYQDGEGDLHR